MKKEKIIKMLFSILVMIPMYLNAEEVNTTYQGEYSLDYLLRNYNAVTFNKMDNPTYDFINETAYVKGDINFSIEGPVLINGDYFNEKYKTDGLTYSTINPNNNVSYISGSVADYVTTNAKRSTNNKFVDFDKLYNQILKESHTLANATNEFINSKDVFINKPGIYQINNVRFSEFESKTASIKKELDDESRYVEIKYIYIDNYDPNDYYIFNIMKTYEFDNYVILIKRQGDTTFTYIDNFIDSGNYTGNIIFNYPTARYIFALVQSGKIVAPNADVIIGDALWSGIENGKKIYIDYNESIISNTITGIDGFSQRCYWNECEEPEISIAKMTFVPLTSKKKIEFDKANLINVEPKENYTDDIYAGEYSINELLSNYSIVSLGLKNYETNTTFYKNETSEKGATSIFHITGQFLINGYVTSKRIDLESNKINESFFKNRYTNSTTGKFFKYWGDGDPDAGTNSVVYSTYYKIHNYDASRSLREYYTNETYINFERLYTKIVEEQKQIKQGILVTPVDGVAHIEIGENYYIEDINQINEIVFDNFEQNSEKMTVITILNQDYINFPKISQTVTGNYVPTKDYFGKKEPMFEYEYYNFPDDIYAGNLIWNVPDSKYIKFETQTPIIGHLVAPNADVEMAETHFAGGFIVNSLYAEGNSEAHFYPLQPVDIPENYDCFVANTNYFNGKWYTDETVVVVNPTAKDVLNPPKEEITNPKTSDGYIVGIIAILVIISCSIGVIFLNKKKTIL